MASGFMQFSDGLPPPIAKTTSVSKEKETLPDITLAQVVKNPDLCSLFETFCSDELAGENFAFWQEAEDYKLIEDPAERRAKLEAIYAKYFSPETDTEVNTSGEEKLAITNARKQADPPLHVFDDVQVSVWVNLSTEMMPRFLRSEMLHRFLNERPDSPNTLASRKKLEDFFGMEIQGPLRREELVRVVKTRGFQRHKEKQKLAKKREKTRGHRSHSLPKYRNRNHDPSNFRMKSSSSNPELMRGSSSSSRDSRWSISLTQTPSSGSSTPPSVHERTTSRDNFHRVKDRSGKGLRVKEVPSPL